MPHKHSHGEPSENVQFIWCGMRMATRAVGANRNAENWSCCRTRRPIDQCGTSRLRAMRRSWAELWPPGYPSCKWNQAQCHFQNRHDGSFKSALPDHLFKHLSSVPLQLRLHLDHQVREEPAENQKRICGERHYPIGIGRPVFLRPALRFYSSQGGDRFNEENISRLTGYEANSDAVLCARSGNVGLQYEMDPQLAVFSECPRRKRAPQ